MRIPILDLKAQYNGIKKQINNAIKNILENSHFVLGSALRKLEKSICDYCNVKYAVGVASGTDAIMLALKALGLPENSGVIVPALTYFATASAVIHAGFRPVFVDIDPLTYNIDPSKIEDYLRRNTHNAIRNTKIKAIIPVHLYGQMADMKKISAIAKKYKLYIIEDAAQAFGASQNGKKAGSLGDIGCFSFYPSKNLGAYGDAGMIVTNNARIADKLRILRNQGDKGKYNHLLIGYNSRLDTLQAAILKAKLKYIDKWNRQRRICAKFYDKALSKIDIQIPYVLKGNMHTYHLYTIRTPQKENLLNHLNKNGIDARTYYPTPVPLAPSLRYLGYKRNDFPSAEKASGEIISIPIYPELTPRKRQFVVKNIKKFFGRKP